MGCLQMLTSVYNNTNADDNNNMYIMTGIAQLSISAVLKMGVSGCIFSIVTNVVMIFF